MGKTAVTINSYNHSADKFAAKFMDFTPYRERIVHFQKEYIANARTIIDLGCGPGNVSKILHDLNPDYDITGIDLSAEMVKLAERNVPSGRFQVGDLREINLPATYDAAIASFCIVHLSNEETETFINNLGGLVNPNGYLYLSFMEGKAPQFETTSFSDKEIYFNYYQQEEVIKQLEAAGFGVEEVIVQDYKEESGETTNDVFVIARRTELSSFATD